MIVKKTYISELIEKCVSDLDNVSSLQKAYYYRIEQVKQYWQDNKANYYNDLLSDEKKANNKTLYSISEIINIFKEIEKRYSFCEEIYFSNDFEDTLTDKILYINSYLNQVKNLYLNLNNDKNISLANDSISIIDNSISNLNIQKDSIDDLYTNINDIEDYIYNEISKIDIQLVTKSPTVINYKGDTKDLFFDHTIIELIIKESKYNYLETIKSMDTLITNIKKISIYYDTDNTSYINDLISSIENNFKIIGENYINNIRLLENELELHKTFFSKLTKLDGGKV